MTSATSTSAGTCPRWRRGTSSASAWTTFWCVHARLCCLCLGLSARPRNALSLWTGVLRSLIASPALPCWPSGFSCMLCGRVLLAWLVRVHESIFGVLLSLRHLAYPCCVACLGLPFVSRGRGSGCSNATDLLPLCSASLFGRWRSVGPARASPTARPSSLTACSAAATTWPSSARSAWRRRCSRCPARHRGPVLASLMYIQTR